MKEEAETIKDYLKEAFNKYKACKEFDKSVDEFNIELERQLGTKMTRKRERPLLEAMRLFKIYRREFLLGKYYSSEEDKIALKSKIQSVESVEELKALDIDKIDWKAEHNRWNPAHHYALNENASIEGFEYLDEEGFNLSDEAHTCIGHTLPFCSAYCLASCSEHKKLYYNTTVFDVYNSNIKYRRRGKRQVSVYLIKHLSFVQKLRRLPVILPYFTIFTIFKKDV